MARDAQITQNNKFAISLQYLKELVSNEVGFLCADSYESVIEIWHGWASIPKVLVIASLQCLYNISKKKLEMRLIFCMQRNIKVSYQLISTLWASKFPTRWYRGLTSPHRCSITSFSQLKRISQSGQDTFFILFFLTFKLLWCWWHFYYFEVTNTKF